MVLDTLNVNSGAITAIATIFLVIVTAFLVIATKQLVDINKTMILAQDKPWLRFYIKPIETTLRTNLTTGETLCAYNLCVKNIGKGSALNVLFNVDLNNQHKPAPKNYNSIPLNEEIAIMRLKSSNGNVLISEIYYEDVNKIERKQENVSLDC